MASAKDRAPADPMAWSAGRVFLSKEAAEEHRRRLVEDLVATHPDAALAHSLINEKIGENPDPEERDHIRLHEVRLLLTYLMTPSGPGSLVDVGASPVYEVPLRLIKEWTVQPVPILSLDYERDPLPFADASQDGVLICEVIEHFVLDPLYCFIEINRILKPGGFVLVTTPNAASWFSIYQALQQKHPSRWPVYAGAAPNERNHIHAREYLVTELVGLLEAAGFGNAHVVTSDYGISPPYCPIPGFSTEHRGETIFCRAIKQGGPRLRYAKPVYLRDVPFEGSQGAA